MTWGFGSFIASCVAFGAMLVFAVQLQAIPAGVCALATVVLLTAAVVLTPNEETQDAALSAEDLE